jgi:hypothetical protein
MHFRQEEETMSRVPGEAWAGRRSARHALAALGSVMLAACVTVQPTVEFDAEQQALAQKQMGQGTGKVTGYAFYHPETGRTYTAGGDWIALIPATPYAEERMRIIYGEERVRPQLSFRAMPTPPSEEFVALTRRVKADIHGKFEFENVMPGRWFVTARVKWQTYDREWKVDEDHDVSVYDEVEVKAGETTKVVLSGK